MGNRSRTTTIRNNQKQKTTIGRNAQTKKRHRRRRSLRRALTNRVQHKRQDNSIATSRGEDRLESTRDE